MLIAESFFTWQFTDVTWDVTAHSRSPARWTPQSYKSWNRSTVNLSHMFDEETILLEISRILLVSRFAVLGLLAPTFMEGPQVLLHPKRSFTRLKIRVDKWICNIYTKLDQNVQIQNSNSWLEIFFLKTRKPVRHSSWSCESGNPKGRIVWFART